jgi:hypothetical protein
MSLPPATTPVKIIVSDNDTGDNFTASDKDTGEQLLLVVTGDKFIAGDKNKDAMDVETSKRIGESLVWFEVVLAASGPLVRVCEVPLCPFMAVPMAILAAGDIAILTSVINTVYRR